MDIAADVDESTVAGDAESYPASSCGGSRAVAVDEVADVAVGEHIMAMVATVHAAEETNATTDDGEQTIEHGDAEDAG